MALILMNSIKKSFVMGDTNLEVLKGISLSIERGEFLAITGQSGSGKSTLMHIIGCLDTPTSGTYLFDNHDVLIMNGNELARMRNQYIGFVFQKFFLLPDMTALANVALPQLYAGKNERQASEQAKKMLDLVELSDRIDHYPNQLSGGQQQRVAIARALVNSPQVILADEPTGNLDSQTGAAIMNIFQTLNKQQGVTIIVVTHDLELAHKTERIIKLKDGIIIADQKTALAP